MPYCGAHEKAEMKASTRVFRLFCHTLRFSSSSAKTMPAVPSALSPSINANVQVNEKALVPAPYLASDGTDAYY